MELGCTAAGDGVPGDVSTAGRGSELSSEPEGGSGRVLVCDDTEQIRRLIRVNLELEGYEVIEAADGEVSLSDVARATGATALRVPRSAAVSVSEMLARLPRVPAAAEWIHVVRSSVVMDTSKAKRELGWRPRYTSAQTLEQMAGVL